MELFLELLNGAIFGIADFGPKSAIPKIAPFSNSKNSSIQQLQTLAMRLDKVIHHLFLEHYSCSSIKSYYNLHTLHKSVDCS